MAKKHKNRSASQPSRDQLDEWQREEQRQRIESFSGKAKRRENQQGRETMRPPKVGLSENSSAKLAVNVYGRRIKVLDGLAVKANE